MGMSNRVGGFGFGIEGSLAKDRNVCLQTCHRLACAGVLTGSPVPGSRRLLRPSPTPQQQVQRDSAHS